MDETRAVKTAGEIARLKIGADVLDDAFTRCFPIAKPGTRERDLHGALMADCLPAAAEFAHGILNSRQHRGLWRRERLRLPGRATPSAPTTSAT